MHRIYLGFSLSAFTFALVLTGCDQATKPAETFAQLKADEKVPPGEAKPIPPGEDKPIPKGDPADPDNTNPIGTKTDPNVLPVLPQLTEPTGEDKYDDALGRAFLLMAENKDAEALAALKEAQAVKESEFVQSEIERIEARMSRLAAAQKAADDIREVLDAGDAARASQLATDALAQYGDSDLAESLTGLKRQADALVSAGQVEKGRGQKLLAEAEAERKANNLRSAVLTYEQAIANGAEPGELKETFESLRTRLVNYDNARSKAAELRKDSFELEQALTSMKVAAENWDTPQIRQEISEAEIALSNRRDRVAIADFEVINDIGIPKAGRVVAEELIGNMKPRFDVVESSQVRTLMTAMKLDNDTFSEDDESRTEFGRIARARFIVLGSVSRLAGIHVNARLVDTQTGLIVQTARIAASNPEEMANRLPVLGRMLQMSDEEKRDYEAELAKQAAPIAPPPPAAEIPPPPPAPPVDAQPPPPPPPAPIVMFTPRPPEFGRVVVADFGRFRFVAANAAPPPPVVIVEAPVLVRNRAFFVSIEVGDNCFRRGLYREALRHFEFALAINPGDAAIRFRVMQCRRFCPPQVVFVPARPRLVVLPFAEFRDPFAIPSSIPPNLGLWTADAIAPYFQGRFDVVDKCQLYWWMGRLGLSLRDVLTNPQARLCLGRALGARYFLMGSLHEVASFDASTHLIDAELNVQTHGARIRVQNAAELRYRLGSLVDLTFLPPPQQVVVVQQQQVVQRKVVAAQVEFRKGNFSVALGFYKEVLVANPQHVEARQFVLQLGFRSRRAEQEAARLAAFQQQQAAMQAQRDRQIALAAASEAARLQAQRDSARNRKLLAQQQIIAQQNLLNQALLAQRQNDLERRVALLESANGIRRDDAILTQLADAKAKLAVERRRRIAAEQELRQAELKKAKAAELAKIERQTLLAAKRREEAQRVRDERNQEEFERFLDQGQKAMAAAKYPMAVSAFQNARRIKETPEVERLVSAALVEQARAEAAANGALEKRQLEAQLAQEAEKRQQLEAQNARLRAKYQAALAAAQDAMKANRFQDAVASFRLATRTMQTDEATNGLRLAEAKLDQANDAAEALAKQKSEEARQQAAIDKHVASGRTAFKAKNFGKAAVAFRAATELKPGDAALQKLLTEAETARDQSLAAERQKAEDAQQKASLRRFVAAGEQNLKAKRFDAAIVSFGEALKIEPENKDALAGLKQAHDAAAAMNTDAASRAEAKKKREAYEKAMRQGRAALSLKQFANAVGHFKEAQALLPGDAASNELIADATKRQSDAESAVMARKKLAELNEALTSARKALRADRFDEAHAAAMKASQLDADNAEAKKLLANIASAKKDYTAAMQKKEMAGKKSAQVDAALDKARAALQEKNLEAASKFLADATAIDATDSDIKKVKAEFDAVRRQMASTADANKKKLAYDLAMKLAQEAMQADKFEDAMANAREALSLKPGDAAATKLLAAARKADKSADAAAMEAEKAKKAYLTAMKTASAAFAGKKYDLAVKEAKAALAHKPGDPAATRLLADATKAHAAAEEAAMEAEKSKKAYDTAMKNGRSAMQAKDYADAEKAFLAALKIAPNDPQATAHLKQARAGLNDMAEMAKRKALYEQWMERAKLLMAKKDYDDAEAAFQNALKVIPGDRAATAGLAAARSAMKAKKDPPTPPKKERPKVDPKPKADPTAAKVAMLMRQAGRDEEAGKYAEAYRTYQQVLKLDPSEKDAKQQSVFCQWMEQGQRHLRAGKNSDAAASFEEALKIDPKNARAKRLLGRAQVKKK